MRGDNKMEEFTSIAIWVLMAFLVINTSIIWFAQSDTFTENASLQIAGLNPDDSFGVEDLNTLSGNIAQNEECVAASAVDPAYSLCLIGQFTGSIVQSASSAVTLLGKFMGSMWTFLTAWYNLLTSVLSGVPGGDLFLAILVPFFGLIEFIAIFVVSMKIAGIVRGGS